MLLVPLLMFLCLLIAGRVIRTEDLLIQQRQQQAAADNQESDEAAVPEEDWVKWDVCTSLFDNKRSSSMQENLEYMYKNFGFYLPDSEYLVDVEGLLQYLGAKLQYGKVGWLWGWVLHLHDSTAVFLVGGYLHSGNQQQHISTLEASI